jgi:signal transduction histidine kinase/ligand-binding sensor domain-containing protein
MKILTKYLLVYFIQSLLLFFTASAQNEHYNYKYVTQPFSSYFSPKEYDASASNWAIAKDNRGIMYFGNSSGLLEFDGTTWRKIKIPFSALVRAIAVDNNGKIFITAGADFGYLEPDSFGDLKFISLKKQLDKVRKIEKEFWDVAVNSNGAFFKTPDEIIRWDGKEFKIWDSVYAYRLYKIGDEIYSRNQDIGLMKIDGDSIYVIPDGDFFKDTGVFDMLPLSEPDKNHQSLVLISTNYSGLFIYDGKKNVPFKTEIDEFLLKNQVYNACILDNGSIALATQRGGVAIIDRKGKLERFLNQSSGLPTNVALDVYPDNLGGLWIATNEGIVHSEINSPLTLIPAEGQIRSQVSSISRFENKIYIANDIGVLVLNPGELKFKLIDGSNKPAYQLLGFNGKLFAATNWGLRTVKGNQFDIEINPESISYLNASSHFPDLFYFGGIGFIGLVKTEIGKSPIVKIFDLTTDEIGSVIEDVDSSLWITRADRPIAHITNKLKGFESAFGNDGIQIDYYSEIERLPGNYWSLFNFEGRLLLGTDKGIYKFDNKNKSFVPDSIFGAEFTSSDYHILFIEKSNKYGYWILAEVNNNYQLGKALLQKDGKYKWRPEPLFQRMEINDVNAIYPDYNPISDKEILWISTSEGLVYYDPEVKKNLKNSFSTLIRKTIVSNDSMVFAGSKSITGSYPDVVIPFSQNDIRFEFSATSYEKSSANQYQYYLEGSDDDWSVWTTETKKDYTNLSGGNYTFKVRAKNIYGVISTEDSFRFKVLPPWYLSLWAYALYAFLIILGIFITDRVMRRKIINRERDKAKLREAELIKRQAQELETVDRLVRVINNAEDLEKLFKSLLEQTVNFIPQAEKAAVFLLDRISNQFNVAYTSGYEVKDLDKITFAPDELKKRYTENSNEIEKGIFIVSNTKNLYADDKLSGFSKPNSMLVMEVEWDGKPEAYVVFDSFADENAFDPSTARILHRFREHAVSAISKAQSLKILQEKNEEIIRTQEKLITQEKLASLGALTAGIAHEIKNPLNFVNNFSEVGRELLDEIITELKNNNTKEAMELFKDLNTTLEKINLHGKRADSIVKGMLLHSRGTSGEKALTNINELLDQFVVLAYHGLRAQDKEFNLSIEKEYDESIGKINIIPQDISRVFLNLVNNASYAAYERKKSSKDDFLPAIKVSTKNLIDKVEIRIRDNGKGIPANVKDKIFNPFFTTKPTGDGTGLGLSLSYDIIVKQHYGEIKFESEEGKYTEFIIILPKN